MPAFCKPSRGVCSFSDDAMKDDDGVGGSRSVQMDMEDDEAVFIGND